MSTLQRVLHEERQLKTGVRHSDRLLLVSDMQLLLLITEKGPFSPKIEYYKITKTNFGISGAPIVRKSIRND